MNQGQESKCDVVIIGGGIIGSSIAYFLASNKDFNGSILVIEKDPSHRESSTALSVGGIRQQFSVPENIEISKYGIHFIKNIDKFLSVDGEYTDVSFVENGYLFLASPDGFETLKENHKLQTGHGANVELLPADKLQQKFSWLNTDGLAGGCLGLRDEGWLDPYSLLRGFIAKSKSLGVEFIKDEVVHIQRDGGKISGLRTASGKQYTCGTAINAAGRKASEVCTMAGLAGFPVHSKKRQVYIFRCNDSISDSPLVIDPSGVYFRPEGKNFICGVSPPPDSDPNSDDFDTDNYWFDEVVWPALAHRVPVFDAIRREHTWAGHYAVNTVDQNAILGPHPELNNFILANGFSGHGLQQAPAVGRAISELIIYGKFASLDLSGFSYDRFAKGRPVRERNVV